MKEESTVQVLRNYMRATGQWRLSSVLVLLLLAFLADRAVAVGNSSLSETILMKRANGWFQIKANSVVLLQAHNSVPTADFSLGFTTGLIVEREKTYGSLDGVMTPIRSSPFPSGIPNTTFDPLEPPRAGVACSGNIDLECGQVLSYVDTSDLDCWSEHVVEPFGPLGNYTRESVYVYMSHPSYSQFRFTMEYHILDGYLEVPITHKNGTIEVQVYEPDALKISLKVENYPWVGADAPIFWVNENNPPYPPYNNISFVTLYWNTTARVPQAATWTMTTSGHTNGYRIDTTSGASKVSLGASFSNLVVTDDVAYSIELGTSSKELFASPSAVTLVFPGGVDGVDPAAVHWSLLTYDPTLFSLFSDTSSPQSPTTRKKGGLSNGAIAGITVGIILLAVVAVVVLATFSPGFRRIIRPFTARRNPPTLAGLPAPK